MLTKLLRTRSPRLGDRALTELRLPKRQFAGQGKSGGSPCPALFSSSNRTRAATRFPAYRRHLWRQAGFNAFLVRDLLGHKTLAMTGRYVEKDADPLERAADAVAKRIAAAMDGSDAAIVSPAPVRRGA